MKQKTTIILYILLSITAAIIILTIAFIKIPTTNTIPINDKLLTTGIFITICIFGISLATHPGWLKKYTRHTNNKLKKKKNTKAKINYKGHHPNCKQFNSHRFKTKNKTYCAGCLGLTIGSIISIILIIFYIVISPKLISLIYYILLIMGITTIGIIFIEIIIPIRKPAIHVISNIFLVISFLFITISMFEITKNVIYSIIAIVLSFLWLDTRIQLSSWQHALICNNCKETCKMVQ